MSTTVLKLKDFESFIELDKPPTTWQGAMEALVAGVVDYDEHNPLLFTCADIADQAYQYDGTSNRPRLIAYARSVGMPAPMIPSWAACCDYFAQALLDQALPEGIGEEIVEMGRVADRWLASQTT